VEKWAGRVIPLASSAIGAGLNYWFVRAGEDARRRTSAAAFRNPKPINENGKRCCFHRSVTLIILIKTRINAPRARSLRRAVLKHF